MPDRERTVLYVDPGGDEGVLSGDDRWRLEHCTDAATATDRLAEHPFDCVVTAFDLPDGNGIELLSRARERQPDVGCVLYDDVDYETLADVGITEMVEIVRRSGDGAAQRLERVVAVTVDERSQTAYPLPPDEDQRLETIERYTPASPGLVSAFERISDVAALSLDMPTAWVSVVGATEKELLASHGTDIERMDREATICTYTILEDGVTVIDDVAEDPRFADSAELRELGITCYAGAPVVVDGATIGTVCCVDDTARTVDERGRQVLGLLAEEAADWIVTHEGSRDTERGLPPTTER